MTLIDTVKWTATSVVLVGAVFASLGIYPASAIVLNLGSVLFLTWGILAREPGQIVVNAGLLLIYTVGLAYKFL